MEQKKLKRSEFIKTSSSIGLGALLGIPALTNARSRQIKNAANAGNLKPTGTAWPGWPMIGQIEKDELLTVLNSGGWCRLGNKTAPRFENEYKKLNGSQHALAVSSGTTALYTMLGALDIGPGDEVIIPPYTFIATYNVIALNYALPVFVDTDIESFQIDAGKIESAITPNTKVIMPVHIGGSPFDIDAVLRIANKHKIPMIEDACQAHLAEWKGKPVGNWGLGGAFSFQASKNLNSGEGGAITTNSKKFYDDCYSFHHQGQGTDSAGLEPGSGTRGSNLRITEFQAAILLAQMSRLEDQVRTRSENADYLTSMLKEIPGIQPAKLFPGVTRSAYHLYMFRYDKNRFSGMDRAKFLNAMSAEGIPGSGGYTSMTRSAYVKNLAKNKHYLKIYGEKKMKDWLDRIVCPQNDKLCEEAVWFGQTMLLGSRSEMEKIVETISNISKNSAAVNKKS